MKKILFLFGCFFLGIHVANASIDVYQRTEDNYLVPPDIVVDSSNEQAVLLTPAVDENLKVYDFAELLSETEEESLYNKSKRFIDNTNYDLIIVTIDENNKNSAEKYADDFFDYNYFGINSSRDGILILIDMDTRTVYISTSGMAIKMYSDARIEGIIDAGYYDLANANYYSCLYYMIDKAEDYFNDGFPDSNKDMYIDENGNVIITHRIPYLTIIFVSGFISAMISLILYFTSVLKIKKQNVATYLNMDSSNVNKQDHFLYSNTSRIRKSSDSEHSGSSSSSHGGSSVHSSSSGRSHGGGGRSF